MSVSVFEVLVSFLSAVLSVYQDKIVMLVPVDKVHVSIQIIQKYLEFLNDIMN